MDGKRGPNGKRPCGPAPPPSIQGLVGTLVHHFFEVLLSETGTPSLQWREALNREAHSRSIEDGEAAGEQAVALVESFLSSPLLDHWRHISIEGREVPMVMRYGGPPPVYSQARSIFCIEGGQPLGRCGLQDGPRPGRGNERNDTKLPETRQCVRSSGPGGLEPLLPSSI